MAVDWSAKKTNCSVHKDYRHPWAMRTQSGNKLIVKIDKGSPRHRKPGREVSGAAASEDF